MENVEDIYPLSPLQGGMLVESLLDPEEDLYFRQFMVRLDGEVDAELLARACERAAERHTVLRTSFVWEGFEKPLQVVNRKVALPFVHKDWRSLPEADQRRELASFLREDRKRGFDLTQAPLLRVALVRLAEGVHRLICTHHHLILDGWSRSLLLQEILALHDELRGGHEAALPPARPFRDYIAWLQRQDLAAYERFWREHLAGFTAPTPIAPERRNGRAAAARSAVWMRRATFPPETVARLEGTARRHQVMLATVVHGAWALLLGRYSGEDDVVFGSVFSGRSAGLQDIDSRLGMLINTLPLRVRLPGAARAMPWLRELQRQLNQLRQYEHSSLADIRRWSGAPLLQPLFETMVVFQPAALLKQSTVALSVSELHGELETNNFACSLMALPRSGIELHLTYDTDRIDPSTAERLLRHLQEILASLAAGPESRLDEIVLLSEGERHQVLWEWNDSRAEPAGNGPGVLHLFERQVDATPSAMAVAAGAESLTYAELNRRANRLAHHLRALGVGPEVLVGLSVRRSTSMIVALLGILKAGGAYLPLDPSYPRERLAYMLEDSGAQVIVTEEALRGALPNHGARFVLLDGDADAITRRPEERPDGDAVLDSLAYVLYTSGSTGRPKGVLVPHGALVNFLLSMRQRPGLEAADILVAVTSLSFDIAGLEVYLPLITGARLVVATHEEAQDGPRLRALLESCGATVLQATPATWHLLASSGWPGTPGLKALCGGETLPEDLAANLLARTAAVWNLYGPTETTIWSTVHPLASGQAVLIGRPIANTTAFVLDAWGGPAPVGVPGELLLGGMGVTRGYLGRPDLTAERFVPDPFGAAGGRLYRTGDLVRRRPDGAMELLGRLDHQVKVRGFRIELGEIEAALRSHPAVAQAVAGVRNLREGPVLVAWIVPADGNGVEPAELREHLRARLPEQMLPSGWVQLAELPLTPNGKIDRKSLPDAEAVVSRNGERPAPMTPAEEVLAGIWSQILGVEGIGPQDHFFALGGHSLLATRLASRLRQLFEVEISLRDVFEAPRLVDLTARVETLRGNRRPERREPVLPVPRDPEGMPLSFGQQRLWFLAQLFSSSPLYNVTGMLRITGPLDAPALAGALQEIVRRHEVLRTVFRDLAGEPRQVVLPARPVALPRIDLSGLGPGERRRELGLLAAEEARWPFDLACGPMLRAKLLLLGAQEHVMLLALHHIVSDGWSMGLLTEEVEVGYSALHAGRPSPLPPLPIQYADFAYWQRQRKETWEDQLSYWRRHLAGVPPVLELPADRPRPVAPSLRGAREYFRLPRSLKEACDRLAGQEGATPFMVALAAVQCLLGRYSGQGDFCIGSPTNGRTRLETERLIGFFLNTLALRARLEGDPRVREALARVRDAVLDAHVHQELPFERLVEELQPERNLSHAPLFQVLFTFQTVWPQAPRLPDLEIEREEIQSGTAKFDLNWVLVPRPNGMTGYVEYSADRFDAATIRRLLEHFRCLLEGFTAAPERRLSELPLLTPAESHQLLLEPNAAGSGHSEHASIHRLFADWVARCPDRPAVAQEDESLTYAGLAARANRLARLLRSLGVGPEVPVALALDRSVEMVTALLAVLAAGGAYVPLDVKQPAARLEWILEDSRAAVVVTREPWRGLAWSRTVVCLDRDADEIAARSPGPLSSIVAPENLAYVLYTSGSTGRPKGVAVEHRQLLNYVQGLVERLALPPGLTYATVSTFGADLGNTSVFGSLCHGGTLHVVPEDLVLDGDGLARYMERHAIDVLKIVPSHLEALRSTARAAAALLPRRLLIVGGEASRPEWIEDLRREGRCAVYNHYGPTETTVGAMTHPASDSGSPRFSTTVPLGRPLSQSRVYVLDAALRPVPVWVPGELCIGGAGISRGYLHQPGLTAGRFVPDPYAELPGARLYRTGDLARILPDGTVEFLGRGDHQVKFHGHRIELEGVRQLLKEHPLVRDGIVLLASAEEDRDVLVAYYVSDHPIEAGELRAFLGRHLVEETLPNFFVHLRQLPLNPTGKVDPGALPPLAEIRGKLETGEAALASPTEELLAGIWSRILGIERIGPDDGFFELGGHSLMATRVIARIREGFGVELPLRALFERPTVRGLAAHIDQLLRDGGSMETLPPITRVDRRDDLPLSFTQRRMWLQDQLRPGTSFYNVAGAVRLRGKLVVEAWQRSLSEIVRRHEILRTVYPRRGEEVTQTVLPATPVALPVIDLSQVPDESRGPEAERISREEARQPFDLATGLLLRVRLLATGDREHVLLLVLHHIAGDGLSINVLVRELGELSEAFSAGRPSPLEELPVQYADFASWQRRWFQGDVLARQVGFWKRQLEGAPPALALPTDRPRPPVQSFWGSRLRLCISPALTVQVQALSRASGTTLFMTLLAAFKVVLRYLSGQDDLMVGTNVAGRQQAATENLIGCFINQLVLRTVLAGGDTFRDLLARVKEVALAVYAHQDLPFEKLVEELKPLRDPSRPLLYQVKMELQNRLPIDRYFRHVEVSRFEVDHPVVRYDLHLAMIDDGSELTGLLHYSTDLFEAATIERIAAHFQAVLAAAVEDPDLLLDDLSARLAERDQAQRQKIETELETLSLHRLKQVRRRGMIYEQLRETYSGGKEREDRDQ